MTVADLETADAHLKGARLLVTVNEAARRLSIGRSTLYELINDGELETLHIGRSCRVTVDSLDAFVDRLRDSKPRASRQ